MDLLKGTVKDLQVSWMSRRDPIYPNFFKFQNWRQENVQELLSIYYPSRHDICLLIFSSTRKSKSGPAICLKIATMGWPAPVKVGTSDCMDELPMLQLQKHDGSITSEVKAHSPTARRSYRLKGLCKHTNALWIACLTNKQNQVSKQGLWLSFSILSSTIFSAMNTQIFSHTCCIYSYLLLFGKEQDLESLKNVLSSSPQMPTHEHCSCISSYLLLLSIGRRRRDPDSPRICKITNGRWPKAQNKI